MMTTKVLTTFVGLVLCAIHEATTDTISNSPVSKTINPPALNLAKKECSSTSLACKLFSEYEDNKHKMARIINEIAKKSNIWSEGLKKILEGEIVRNQKTQTSAAIPAQEEDEVANFINLLITGDMRAFVSSKDDQMDAAVLLMEMIGDICRDRKLIHHQTQDLLSEMFHNLMNKIGSLFINFVSNNSSVNDETHEKLKSLYQLLPCILTKIQTICNQMMSNLNNTDGTLRSSDAAHKAICENLACFDSLQQLKDDFIASIFDILDTVVNINGFTDVEQMPMHVFDEIIGCARIIDSIFDFVISFKDLKEEAPGWGFPSQASYFFPVGYYSTQRMSNALAALALDLYAYSIDDHRTYFRYVDQFLCSSNIAWWAENIGNRIPLQQLGDLNMDEARRWVFGIKRQISDALSRIEGNSASDDDFTSVPANIKNLEAGLGLSFIAEPNEQKRLRDFSHLAESRLKKGLENRRLSWESTRGPAAALISERRLNEWSGDVTAPSAPGLNEVFEHSTINVLNDPSDLQTPGTLYPLLSEDEQLSNDDTLHPPSYAEATGYNIDDTFLGPPPSYDEIVQSSMKNIVEDSVSTNVEVFEEDENYEATTDEKEGHEEGESSKDTLLPQVDKKLSDDPFYDTQDFVSEEQKIIFDSAYDIFGEPDEAGRDLTQTVTNEDASKPPSFFDAYLILAKPVLAIAFILLLAKLFYDFY